MRPPRKSRPEFSIIIEIVVKQDDPLPAIIFNICLDELIERLESKYISCLAFADDLILLAETRKPLRNSHRN